MKKFRWFGFLRKKGDKEQENNNNTQVDKRFYSPRFDTLGSYTGNGLDPLDTPEQDSDDL